VSALLAYQLSRTPADIEAVFGAAGDPCRAGMITAMDRANTVDLVGFIPTYSAFLACFFLALMRAGAGVVARVGLAAVVATLGFDVLETSTQSHITRALPGSAAITILLHSGGSCRAPSHVKRTGTVPVVGGGEPAAHCRVEIQWRVPLRGRVARCGLAEAALDALDQGLDAQVLRACTRGTCVTCRCPKT
jgi:hypothetical protein